MGLDFGQSEAHWGYGGFMRFRERLASMIGILDLMAAFNRDDFPWDKYPDPITLLINHSDCDGQLTAEECGKIAPRLREMVTPWPEGDYDKRQALLLADGMDKCAKKKRPLVFC
jgi:hypothetical protein